MSATPMQHAARLAQHHVEFYNDKVLSDLQALEHKINEIRNDIARGNVYEARNLVATAGDVADSLGKLRSALDRVEAFKLIRDEEAKDA